MMSDAEKQGLKEVARGMSEEEMKHVIRTIPNNILVKELERRIRVATKKLDAIMYALAEKEDDLQEQEKEKEQYA